MAIQKCHECGKDVSTTAKACPNCGASVKKPLLQKNIGCFGIVISLLIFLWVVSKFSAPSFDSYKEKAKKTSTSTQILAPNKSSVKVATPLKDIKTGDCISTLDSNVCVGESHDSVIAKLGTEYVISQKVTQSPQGFGPVVEREYSVHGKHFFITFGRTDFDGPHRVLKIKRQE